MAEAVKEVAKIIGDLARDQRDLQESVNPNDAGGSFISVIASNFALAGTVIATKKELTGVWILGHPVYGELGAYPLYVPVIMDHPVYGKLDYSYITNSATYQTSDVFDTRTLLDITFPISFPINYSLTGTTKVYKVF